MLMPSLVPCTICKKLPEKNPSNMTHVLFDPIHCSLAMPDVIACCKPVLRSRCTRTWGLTSTGPILPNVKQTSALLGLVHYKDIAG